MDLDQKARSILAHPELYPALGNWGSVELLLRIWQYPSFQHASSWALGHREDGYRVRRLEWDHITDRRWPHGTPTIYGSEAALPDVIGAKRRGRRSVIGRWSCRPFPSVHPAFKRPQSKP
jgi:hypothetical protein